MTASTGRHLDLMTMRIKVGAGWRGVKYFALACFDPSNEYAKHVVETLGVAKYVQADSAKSKCK